MCETGGDDNLPDTVEFAGDQETAWRVFGLLEATANADGVWQFLPSQLMAESETLVDDVLLLKSLLGKIKKQGEEQG